MDRFDANRRPILYAIAMLAGFVDATGYMQAGGYFVSFMSGNTTLLALDVARSSYRVLAPAALIAGFVAGVAAGTWLGDRHAARRKRNVLAAVALLLIVAASLRANGEIALSTATLVLAMGAANTAPSGNRTQGVGLTYMTGALVRLGQALGARLGGSCPGEWRGFLLLWISLLAGAVCGALLTIHAPAWPLWIGAGMAAVLAAFAARLPAEV